MVLVVFCKLKWLLKNFDRVHQEKTTRNRTLVKQNLLDLQLEKIPREIMDWVS